MRTLRVTRTQSGLLNKALCQVWRIKRWGVSLSQLHQGQEYAFRDLRPLVGPSLRGSPWCEAPAHMECMKLVHIA